MLDDIMFKDTIKFALECTSFEHLTLFKDYGAKRIGESSLITIGNVDYRPVCIDLSIAQYKDVKYVTYETSSELVDYALIEKFIKEKFVNAKIIDTFNFHHIINSTTPDKVKDYDFIPSKITQSDYLAKVDGILTEEILTNILYRTSDIKIVDGVEHVTTNLKKYAWNVGNIMSINGEIDDSTMLSLCFSKLLLNYQVPESLGDYIEQFEDGYRLGGQGLLYMQLCDRIYEAGNPRVDNTFNDTLMYDEMFTDGLIDYYIHNSGKYIFRHFNGEWTVADIDAMRHDDEINDILFQTISEWK